MPRLSLVDQYSDAPPCIVDEHGFEIVQVEQIAVLLDFAKKLGIRHWADSPKASRELDDDEADALARRIVLSFNAHDALLASAQRAEEFIAGFEDDASQEGVRALLADLRAAIAEATGSAA